MTRLFALLMLLTSISIITGQNTEEPTNNQEEALGFPEMGRNSFENDTYFFSRTTGLNFYTFEMPMAGVFYLSVHTIETGIATVYLSSTCACNSPPGIPATAEYHCKNSSTEKNYLNETSSGQCVVYYTIDSPIEPAVVNIQFFPLEQLPLFTTNPIKFAYPDSTRNFAHSFGSEDFPAIFYLNISSIDLSTEINVYVASDCESSCSNSPDFTRFPSETKRCWEGVTNEREVYFTFSVQKACSIYYGVKSSQAGESVRATMSIYKTDPLENGTLTTLSFPLRGRYRTFYQDIAMNEVFYINSYSLEATTTTNLYISSNCSLSCADSMNYTVYPTMNQHCWESSNNYYFVVAISCRVYYSIYSSESGETAKVRGSMYRLGLVPFRSAYTITFPFSRSYRWFYTEIDPEETTQVALVTNRTDRTVASRVFITTNCTMNCFRSSNYTHYPTYSTNCGWGDTEVVIEVEVDQPCRVYYSIYSSQSGEKVTVETLEEAEE